MSSVLNPLHPGALFVQKKIGQTFLASFQVTMPPASTLIFQIAPPAGRVWILTTGIQSPVRDAATNNPVVSPNIFRYFRNSMLVGNPHIFGLESNFMSTFNTEIDLKADDPLVVTATNGTALTIYFDVTLAIMEITQDKYDQYLHLWDGLYNLEWILGALQLSDVEGLINVLKMIAHPVVALGTVSEEKSSSPSMAEDTGKGIKRIEIP